MNLLRDLTDWCNEHDRQQMGSKALRIYNKCMLAGKNELAQKIEQKHRRHFPKSDLAISFGMMLMATEQTKTRQAPK